MKPAVLGQLGRVRVDLDCYIHVIGINEDVIERINVGLLPVLLVRSLRYSRASDEERCQLVVVNQRNFNGSWFLVLCC